MRAATKQFIPDISALYTQMEKAYDELAEHYSFSCGGCGQNCCTQRFYHYTFAEYVYLHEGLRSAAPELAAKILHNAGRVTDSYTKELQIGEILPLMCPVNSDGMCTLYEYRPMICRLHGLPHKFTRPDGTVFNGGGCHRFEADKKADRLLDRTFAYTELAHLEKDLRLETNFRQRLKKTTAEMLMDMLEEDPFLQDLIEKEHE
jgi:Fe-S-cluster containining protein